MKRVVSAIIAFASAAAVAVQVHGQAPASGQQNYSGTWKLTSVDPPVPAGRGRGGGGGVSGPYADTMLAQAPETMTVTQSAATITVQIGPSKIAYTLDNQTTELPPGDVMAFKSRAHWEAGKLLRTGLTEIQALNTVTISAAKAIAIDDKIGSLEAGKDATVDFELTVP